MRNSRGLQFARILNFRLLAGSNPLFCLPPYAPLRPPTVPLQCDGVGSNRCQIDANWLALKIPRGARPLKERLSRVEAAFDPVLEVQGLSRSAADRGSQLGTWGGGCPSSKPVKGLLRDVRYFTRATLLKGGR